MHTLLLSSVLTKEVYDEILLSTPYNTIHVSSPFVRMVCIDNDRLLLSSDDKEIMPDIYLFQFEQTKKTEKKIQGTGVITYFLEIRINYNKSVGGTGYYTIPVEHTKTFVYETLISLVCTHIPALRPVPKEFSHFQIRLADYAEALPPQDFFQTTEHRTMNLKLRRIDFAYDITTDYKEILLDLISKGYRPQYFKDNATVYYGKNANEESITESSYLKSKSVYINVYDKENELIHHNKALSPSDKDKIPYLLRFEVQVHKSKLQYIIKKERNNNSTFKRDLDSFLSNEIEYTTLKYYMESLVGTGQYFYYKTALDIINNSSYTSYQKNKLCAVIYYVSKYHGIYKFLEHVENGTITDMGTLGTAKNYLKLIHALGINPVTISDSQRTAMMKIQKKYPMPDIAQYKYGEDFIFNPLVNLEIIYRMAEELKYEI